MYNPKSMKGTFLLFLLLSSGLLNLIQPLQAQVEASPPAQVSVDFRILAWKTNVPSLRYSTRGTIEALESYSCSEPQHYTGPETLAFYSNKKRLSPQRIRMQENAVASVAFPQGASRFTLLAIPKGRRSYHLYAVPENGELLPQRFVLLHNFTDYAIRIDYNQGDRVQIAAQDTAYIQLNQGATVVHVSFDDKGKWRKLFNNVVELNSESRANVFFTKSAERPVTMIPLPHWPVDPAQVEIPELEID